MSTSVTSVHLNVADGFWNTCEHAGTTTTFRVLTPENGEPVEVQAFLSALAARITRLDASLKEVTSDFSGADATVAERDGDVRLAAESVYKSLEVEVSLLDDPAAVPEDPSCDAAVDLWLPMHLAVVVQHEAAIKALLAFHHNHALTVLQQLASEALGVEECMPATGAGLAASPSLNATRTSSVLVSAAATTSGVGGASVSAGDDDTLASGEQTPCHKPTYGQEVGPMRSSASPEDTRLNLVDARAEAFPLHKRPVVELQIRPDLGNTLVLLGHYAATPSSVAVAAAPVTSSTRTTKPTASPMRRSSINSALGASHASDPSTQSHHPRSHSHVDPAAAAATAAPAGEPEDGVLEWLNLNAQQMELEETLFQDAGDELCVENVLGMLKSLVRFAVMVAEEEEGAKAPAPRAFTVGDLVDPEVLGHLYISSTVLFDACKGDLQRLQSVFTAFQGSLTPVIRGKSLPYSISGKSFVQQRSSIGGGAALSDTPTMRPISRTSSGPLSQMVSTPRGRPSGGGGGGGGVALAPLALPSGVHTSSTPFWVNCAPQDSLQLAFVGLWVALREQYTEGLGSARGHRHVGIRQDYRMAIAGLKKARLPNLASCRGSGGGTHLTAMATVVPTASSIVSSGQLFLISRLLSSECRVEEFLDLTEDATFFHSLAPASFTGATAASSTNATNSTSANNNNQTGFCGTLPLVLAASAFVASELRAPGQVRLTATKMETLLGDTRTNTLRAYVCGRPATHAERFEELWLGASQDTSPKKFKTRAEMLFYSTIEQVLLSAERTWAEEKAAAAAGARAETTTHAHDHLASMAKGLQSWIVMWRNFLISVRDRPVLPGAVHRRSISSVSRTSATATPKMQPMAPPSMSPPPVFDVSNSTTPTALAPDPVAAVTAAVGPGTTPANATEDDEASEATETFQRLLDALPLRLQHGEPPLPEIGAQICPPSAPSVEDASAVTELPQTTLDSEFEYSQHAFGEMAGSEANDIKLKFYGLFKQATVGDINISKPWLMDQVGRAKWEAWNKLKGMNVMDAKRMYVSEFKLLKHMRAAPPGAAGAK